MSFRNPFKQHASKKSAISKKAEDDFDKEVQNLKDLEKYIELIQKDMRRVVENQDEMYKAELKLAENFENSSFCKDADLNDIGEKWRNSVEQFESVMKELNSSTQTTVTEPLKRIMTVFPSAQLAIRRREQCLQEYNKCLAKVEKYKEKDRTGAHIVKLQSSQKSLNFAKNDYEELNSQLMEDLPKLHAAKIEYFHPSFQSLVHLQLKHFTECQTVYSELNKDLGAEILSDDDHEQKISQIFSEIKSLSITADE